MSSSTDSKLQYIPGFGNHAATEAVKGALPIGQNTPQVCPLGLYAEQLNGTAFTAPRASNQRTWFYRIRPSVMHTKFSEVDCGLIRSNFDGEGEDAQVTPAQLRWMPLPLPAKEISRDFVQGLVTFAGAGSPSSKSGLAIHVYAANKSMGDKCMCNADGDFLFVPQQGRILITTEMGKLEVEPTEIAVVQRGIKFSVDLPDGDSRGYVLEVYSGHFKIPDLGPIGANGLANPRDFLVPVAAYEDRDVKTESGEPAYTLVHKFCGKLFEAKMGHSPFDVVAWHGNYAPFKYDLKLFNTVNTVSYDHMDPSIFTVLTCATLEPGVAVADFVIFPPRWGVAEHTFRPPWYHRNTMSEYMGLIHGLYEAKEKGFLPGGGSLHSCMTAHGPETEVFEKASTAELKPQRVADGSLAFMFESTYMFKLTKHAMENNIDEDYWLCWQGLKKNFSA